MSRKLFAVRKCRGQWSVCSEENVLLNFDSYQEALETARSAVSVLAESATAKRDDDRRF